MALQPALPHLDQQINSSILRVAGLNLGNDVSERLASTIYAEVFELGELVHNRLRRAMAVSPEDYLDEMGAFQRWTDIAHGLGSDPVIVRAHVMTQLYVAFVWLRDSLLDPLAAVLAHDAATSHTIAFLRTGERRRLRNAVAHGRWRYMDDFSGLDCWDGVPATHFAVPGRTLDGGRH